MRTLYDESSLQTRIKRFWQRSYAADWLGFAVLLTAYLLIQFFIEPFHRMFSLDDRSKSYPHAEIQRVSSLQNILYAGVAPLSFLLIFFLISSTTTSNALHMDKNSWHKPHITILGFLTSLILTSLLTDIVKNAVGRPRPDLISRCKPMQGTPLHVLVTIAVCTETDHHTLHDGWRSFPSGHSSFAFAGLGYLSLFLAGQMHVFRPRTSLPQVIVCLVPLLGAGMIAMSRLADYRHDVFDVIAGSALGMSVAWFCYRRYYRSVWVGKCDVPYESRGEWGRRYAARVKGVGRKDDVGDEDAIRVSHVRDGSGFTIVDSSEEDDDDRSEIMPLERMRQEEV